MLKVNIPGIPLKLEFYLFLLLRIYRHIEHFLYFNITNYKHTAKRMFLICYNLLLPKEFFRARKKKVQRFINIFTTIDHERS